MLELTLSTIYAFAIGPTHDGNMALSLCQLVPSGGRVSYGKPLLMAVHRLASCWGTN